MDYKYTGGLFAPTSCIKSVLVNKNYLIPRQSDSYSEELLFGISGGIGFGYILWHYKSKQKLRLSLSYHNHWSNENLILSTLCKRMGLDCSILETTSKRKAYNNLRTLLDKEEHVLVWVDRNKLPYNFEPYDKMEKSPHVIIVTNFDRENNTVTIDDQAHVPFQISMDDLALARTNIPSLNNCQLHIKSYSPPESLSTIVMAGIDDFIEKMGSSSQSFALPAIKKWARMINSNTNQKGWPVLFTNPSYLFSVLVKIFENTTLVAGDGHGLRYMYANFLKEAKSILNKNGLDQVAEIYNKCGDKWAEFANLALPDEISIFAKTKELLTQKYQSLRSLGSAANATLSPTAKQLQRIYQDCQDSFPLDESTMMDLFNNMSDKLLEIYDLEKQALLALKQTLYGL